MVRIDPYPQIPGLIREYAGDKLTNRLDSSREVFHTITHSRVHTFLCDYMKV